jgi:pantoate--beta-alanine ligase
MIIVKKISEIQKLLAKEKADNKKISFVPTMGALHEGHLTLIKKAKKISDIVVVSIFVNKAQFNDGNDFVNYPRQEKNDIKLLKLSKVDYLFIPNDAEIYQENQYFSIAIKDLNNCLCGVSRKNHFEGVAKIIIKLFNIVKPDLAIFGEKDFQQLMIIKKLVKEFNFLVKIVSLKTVREKSGLAMSSRNQRLSKDGKNKAKNLFKMMSEVKSEIKKNNQINKNQIDKIIAKAKENLLKIGFEKIDYFEIRSEENLTEISEINKSSARIFAAVYLEKVRLIDNLKI